MDSDGLAEESIKKEQNKSLTPPCPLAGNFLAWWNRDY
jgi:hypothetical protein